jgi:hypothetical protein
MTEEGVNSTLKTLKSEGFTIIRASLSLGSDFTSLELEEGLDGFLKIFFTCPDFQRGHSLHRFMPIWKMYKIRLQWNMT